MSSLLVQQTWRVVNRTGGRSAQQVPKASVDEMTASDTASASPNLIITLFYPPHSPPH